MFCVNCGSKVEEGWKFCNNCGHPLAPAATPQKNAASWVQDKKYEVRRMEYEERSKYRTLQKNSELKTTFYGDNFVVLEDGTQIGFIFGHIEKYQAEDNFHYNLYKITPDGKAVFLNGGIRGSIETFYVLNGVAYCEYCNDKMEFKID